MYVWCECTYCIYTYVHIYVYIYNIYIYNSIHYVYLYVDTHLWFLCVSTLSLHKFCFNTHPLTTMPTRRFGLTCFIRDVDSACTELVGASTQLHLKKEGRTHMHTHGACAECNRCANVHGFATSDWWVCCHCMFAKAVYNYASKQMWLASNCNSVWVWSFGCSLLPVTISVIPQSLLDAEPVMREHASRNKSSNK